MNRKTPPEVQITLSNFDRWMKKEKIASDGGRREFYQRARLILNDLNNNSWTVENYLIEKEKQRKIDGSRYKDSTLYELKRAHYHLIRFLSEDKKQFK